MNDGTLRTERVDTIMGTGMIKNLKAILFYAGAVGLCAPPLFVFAWMIMTGLKTGVQNISYPPEFIFLPRWKTSGRSSSSTTFSCT